MVTAKNSRITSVTGFKLHETPPYKELVREGERGRKRETERERKKYYLLMMFTN